MEGERKVSLCISLYEQMDCDNEARVVSVA